MHEMLLFSPVSSYYWNVRGCVCYQPWVYANLWVQARFSASSPTQLLASCHPTNNVLVTEEPPPPQAFGAPFYLEVLIQTCLACGVLYTYVRRPKSVGELESHLMVVVWYSTAKVIVSSSSWNHVLFVDGSLANENPGLQRCEVNQCGMRYHE